MMFISSRDNALLKTLRRLSQDSTAYRREQRIWLEGDHLCRAALQRGVQPEQAVFAQSAWDQSDPVWAGVQSQAVVMPDALFASISQLESPARMGFVLRLPDAAAIEPATPTVVLDRLQDAGNVGAILRCAAAFGFRQVLALTGTAALWSPKVLRAGMGAHFGLRLREGLDATCVDALALPVLTTSSHQGPLLHELTQSGALPAACAWVLGHEGQGVSPALMQRADLQVRIAQPGGEESLNVAAAAAICLHASACMGLSSSG